MSSSLINEMSEQEQQAVASQLSCPTGADGLEVAKHMNDTNDFISARSIEALALKAGESIVEIGPANGVLSRPLVDTLGASGHYMGVEMSSTMAKVAAETLADSACHVTIHCGNCLEVELEPASLDAVIAVNVLYFIDDLAGLFTHLLHWLKPGGRVVFGVRSDTALKQIPFTRYQFAIRSIDEMTQALAEAGFDDVQANIYDEGQVPLGEVMIPVDSVILSAHKPL